MSELIDRTNSQFGCWTILSKSRSIVQNCGTKHVLWKCFCNKCESTFEISSKNIARRCKFPEDCEFCRVKSNKKGILRVKMLFTMLVNHAVMQDIL